MVSKRLAKWNPMKPAAPVIKTLFALSKGLKSAIIIDSLSVAVKDIPRINFILNIAECF